MEKLYVLGHPVAHSKSPAMYNAVYRALGLDWRYELADCETEAQALDLIESRDFLSLNITTPYKPLAFARARVRTSSAALASGANVLVNKAGSLVADNTDGLGCVSYLKRRGVVFGGASVALCGTGPTARAIMHACALAGAARIVLFGRDELRTTEVLNAYRDSIAALALDVHDVPTSLDPRYATVGLDQIMQSCRFEAVSYEKGESALASADIIIDATSLGMREGDPSPFDTTLISSCQTVFDVVYAHGTTALVAGARAQGARVFDGEGMLVSQAVATLHDIAATLELNIDFDAIDLFSVMAAAAGFTAL